MAKIGEMLPSKYLKQSDVEYDTPVTIVGVEQVNVAPQGAETDEWKWTVMFEEFDKPMVLNSTNIQLLAKACKSDDTDDWTGKSVILYADPNVSYGGKLVGGLRVKAVPPPRPATTRQAPRTAQRPAAKNESQGFAEQDVPLADMDDDIPF